MVRKARIADARAIHKLLLGYAREGMMLSRSLPDIYENIRDFYVFEENGETVGTVCLHICWEDLAEVRSLAVSADCEGRGLGRELVEACLAEARDLGMKRVFALTYKPVFFAKLGFHEIEKSELPQKIWGDCMKCAKFPECDEIALSITL
ncbi:acetyltransferase [Desulfuromonas sp. DDH964]|uniref:N-acetyltransferase n=1 Tax=Desulfuromonas sp. DDH964 TaxID=1823759 RepID=UPI00078D7490|nr:N-acetyltransferase [Desulfuromonas sp. DDH964]AMV72976.1 acetyltransferase [Desulfuromonas sp. DDH964]